MMSEEFCRLYLLID